MTIVAVFLFGAALALLPFPPLTRLLVAGVVLALYELALFLSPYVVNAWRRSRD